MAKKKDEIPEEINKELESPKFGKPKSMTNTGYILDIDEKEKTDEKYSQESIISERSEKVEEPFPW